MNKQFKYPITMLVLLITILFAIPNQLRGQIPDSLWTQANQQYSQSNFEQAAQLYQQLVDQNQVSADLYFNLGNAYYKQNLLGLARLNYEKALRIEPNNEDILTNIQFAKNAQLDKIEELNQLPITIWLNNITNALTSDMWAICFLLIFGISLVFFVAYMLAGSYRVRQLNFMLSTLFLLVSIGFFVFGHRQRNQQLSPNQAIILSPVVTVKSSPDQSGADLFIIHEGLKVDLLDQQGSWVRIKLSDGKSQGWVQNESISTI